MGVYRCVFASIFFSYSKIDWGLLQVTSGENGLALTVCVVFLLLLCAEKLAKALPDAAELAKLMPDLEKIGENFTFLKSLLSTGMSVTF